MTRISRNVLRLATYTVVADVAGYALPPSRKSGPRRCNVRSSMATRCCGIGTDQLSSETATYYARPVN
jgi:hypothetical protein